MESKSFPSNFDIAGRYAKHRVVESKVESRKTSFTEILITTSFIVELYNEYDNLWQNSIIKTFH